MKDLTQRRRRKDYEPTKQTVSYPIMGGNALYDAANRLAYCNSRAGWVR